MTSSPIFRSFDIPKYSRARSDEPLGAYKHSFEERRRFSDSVEIVHIQHTLRHQKAELKFEQEMFRAHHERSSSTSQSKIELLKKTHAIRELENQNFSLQVELDEMKAKLQAANDTITKLKTAPVSTPQQPQVTYNTPSSSRSKLDGPGSKQKPFRVRDDDDADELTVLSPRRPYQPRPKRVTRLTKLPSIKSESPSVVLDFTGSDDGADLQSDKERTRSRSRSLRKKRKATSVEIGTEEPDDKASGGRSKCLILRTKRELGDGLVSASSYRKPSFDASSWVPPVGLGPDPPEGLDAFVKHYDDD